VLDGRRAAILLRVTMLLLVAVVPLAVLKSANDYVIRPKAAVALLGALAAFGFLLGTRGFNRARSASVAAPLAVIVFLAVLGASWAVDRPQAVRLAAEQAGWAVLCLAAAATPPAWGKVLGVTLASLAVQLGVAVMQLNGHWIVGHGEQFGPGRIYATLGNPSFFGVYLAPVAVWLLYAVVTTVRRGAWTHAVAPTVGLAAVLFLMAKAAVIDAWAGFAVGGALVLWLAGERRVTLKRISPALLVLVLGAVAALAVLGPRLHDRFDYLRVKAFSWHAAAWLWRDHPILGAGPGEFQTRAPVIMAQVHALWTGPWKMPLTFVAPHDEAFAHQDFLQMLAETGVVGFGAWLWLVVIVFRAGYRDRSRAPYLGALAAFAPTMCLHFPLHLASSALVFWLCAGWAAGSRGRDDAPGRSSISVTAVATAMILLAASAIVVRSLVAEVYLGIGYRNFRAGAPAQAVPLIERFEKLAPDHFEGVFYAGAMYQALGDDGAAIARYEHAIALYPGMQGAMYNLGNVYFRRRDYDSAIAAYTRALAINPCLIEAVNNRGNALALKGLYDRADNDYLSALTINPVYVDALFNLAVNSIRKGRRADAKRWLARALGADPGYRPARDLAAELGVKRP
jgi:Tfp pilus assembly protein PilF